MKFRKDFQFINTMTKYASSMQLKKEIDEYKFISQGQYIIIRIIIYKMRGVFV